MTLAKKPFTYVAGALTCLAAIALSTGVLHAEEKKDAHAGHGAAAAGGVDKAICVLTPTEGSQVHGTVTFTKQADGVLIEANVEGLAPDSEHGFHIHEFGDLTSPDGTAMGGHFNPTKEEHGAPDASMRHDGDFGNLKADASGKAAYSRVDNEIKIEGEHGILGRGMIVHANQDDLKTQPTGNAGARIAQGVIGVAKVEKKS